jgi:hypothetical protein
MGLVVAGKSSSWQKKKNEPARLAYVGVDAQVASLDINPDLLVRSDRLLLHAQGSDRTLPWSRKFHDLAPGEDCSRSTLICTLGLMYFLNTQRRMTTG